jgi:xylose isomerase
LLNRFRPDSVVLEAASFGGRLLADDVVMFEFDLSDGHIPSGKVCLDVPIREQGIDNRPAFAGHASANDYCAHWYQAARLLVPPVAVEPGMTLRVEARHNRQSVAVMGVYDPVTGAPL